MSLPPKPVRTRSNLSLLPQLPNVYKSSFYKAAADEHLANKIRRQAPVVKKQYQPPPLPKPKAEKGPHSATGGSCPLPPVNKRGSRYSVTSDGAGLVEGSDMWSDRSNSWAITEIPPAKPLGPKGKVDIPTCTSAPYPDLTPLDSLVSLARQRELEEAHIRLHHKRMAQLANNRRMMMHMYHLSKLHAQIFAASNFKTIDERVLLTGRESAMPTSRPLSAKS
uniref:Uncharacterized protein n=1 Tax=Amphimedon queenslandica TaxID=400682 RepID=A0A1X7SQF3_AMPQE